MTIIQQEIRTELIAHQKHQRQYLQLSAQNATVLARVNIHFKHLACM